MSYNNVSTCLPESLVQEIQKYIQGEYIYIPKESKKKRAWGSNTGTKIELEERNSKIYLAYHSGKSSKELSLDYFLSIKSIQRILLNEKKRMMP